MTLSFVKYENNFLNFAHCPLWQSTKRKIKNLRGKQKRKVAEGT